MTRTTVQVSELIAKKCREVDVRFGYGTDANSRATPNSSAKRIKGDELVRKNLEEPNWPGERTHYEIDRDQILFNPAFFRLARKAQVFIGQRDPLYRNRLTHTLEVVQFSRSVAKANGLNLDLVEAIAYGHDLGHAPFGHVGERALNSCLYEYYVRQLLDRSLKDLGFDRPPIRGIEGKDQDSSATRDRALWTLIEYSLPRYPNNYRRLDGLRIDHAISLVGQNLFRALRELGIVQLDANDVTKCAIAPPPRWNWQDNQVEDIQKNFWMSDTGRYFFSHNVNSLRILIQNFEKPNVDITYQTAYGILFHPGAFVENLKCQLFGLDVLVDDSYSSPEAFLVQKADDICFTNSDFEDARRSGLLEWEYLNNEERLVFSRLGGRDGIELGTFPESSQRLQFCETGFGFKSNSEYEYRYSDLIKQAREIVRERLYPVLVPRQRTARRIVRDLFWFFYAPSEGLHGRREIERAAKMELAAFAKEKRIDDLPPQRIVSEFIAYMTDEEAIATHNAVFAPDQRRWPRYFSRSADE